MMVSANAIARTEEGRESVVIVGDTKQSIYRWRGGDWRLIEGSLTDAIDRPEVVTTDLLDTNYRSRRNIIRFNNSLMRSVVDSCNGAPQRKGGGGFRRETYNCRATRWASRPFEQGLCGHGARL